MRRHSRHWKRRSPSERSSEAEPNHPGSAYCLLAQTLEAQGEVSPLSFQRCCQLGDSGNPEDKCMANPGPRSL